MAVLKNLTKRENYMIVSKNFSQDRRLNLEERGLYATMNSLPDEWNFSVAGMAQILPDGRRKIQSALDGLVQKGYVTKRQTKDDRGKFARNIIEINERPATGLPSAQNALAGNVPTENPSTGDPSAENVPQYITKEYRNKEYSNDLSISPSFRGTENLGSTASGNPDPVSKPSDGRTDRAKDGNPVKVCSEKSIVSSASDGKAQSAHEKKPSDTASSNADAEKEAEAYHRIIADNIHLDWLLEAANKNGDAEEKMVQEVYGVICRMVCYPRESVTIKGTKYPWNVVKSQFLKLAYDQVADVLNRVIDADLHIRHMESYLISTLFTEASVGTLESESSIHDDYLKSLRGTPYT